MNIIITFDDGRSDSYFNAYKILKKYNLPATFFVTTGFIDGTFKTDAFGVNRKSISLNELTEMSTNGMEIASHGDKHVMEENDFYTSKAKLDDWVGNSESIGFSVPNSKYTEYELSNFIKYCEKSLSYVRVGRNKKCYSFLNKLNYILYKMTKIDLFYNCFNKANLISGNKSYVYHSAVIKKHIKASSICHFIEKYKNSDKTLVLMFHSICESEADEWEYSCTKFDFFCNYLCTEATKNKIKVLTLSDYNKIQSA